MNEVRLGLIGLGVMGLFHFKYMPEVVRARLTAVCDSDPKRLEPAAEHPHKPRTFADPVALLDSKLVDAVLIATPHFLHPEISIAAMQRDLHVLTEKPVAVTVGAARKVNEFAATKRHLKYAAMFNQRAWPHWVKLHAMMRTGELGEISRVTWIATDWFRPWSYYSSGSWRATWRGEGGGVLINQCPHNLDLLCWFTNLPIARVTAVVNLGKTHPIETEDEASAIVEFANGAVGQFITTTGEAPGTNLLEIAGDNGLVRVERGKVLFRRAKQSVRQFRETSPGPFSVPEIEQIDVALDPAPENSHKTLTQNFINAILQDEPLIAPAAEGIKGLELGNAMLMSGLSRKPVELPLDAASFDRLLTELQSRASTARK
jgi:predicted dehydrogenase